MPKASRTRIPEQEGASPGAASRDSTEMFSAASFAGVHAKYERRQSPAHDDVPNSACPVVAFYGFRGGAGRTTALAHVVALLAARQVSVVAIDLDLEAPGLHHVLACPPPDDDRGTLALLRAAAMVGGDSEHEALRLAPHLLKSRLDLGTPIRVLPAGKLNQQYLERLDDLGVPLWHISEGPSPLATLMQRVSTELSPRIICLDCRTGLSGLSAAALFHVADLVVCFVPVSEQSLEGLEIFLRAATAATQHRVGRPEILIVPSMVPEGPEGRNRLENWFLAEIEARYLSTVMPDANADERETWVDELPILREGIEYRRGIALADGLPSDFVQGSAGVYQRLLERLVAALGLDQAVTGAKIDTSRILSELKQRGNLKSLPFAEEDREATLQRFTRPHEFKALVDRSTWYVKGAKGAGKTALWLYLQAPSAADAAPGMTFVAAHGPAAEILPASAIRELERDRAIRMIGRQLHGAFWLLCSVKRIAETSGSAVRSAVARFRGDERTLLEALIDASPAEIAPALRELLILERCASLADQLIRAVDAELLNHASAAVTLLFDGLDVGFGSDRRSLEMRSRFVSALVESIEPLRGSCKRIFFKLFLREDIFGELSIQNQSHLEAATIELRWEPRDMWELALNLMAASPHYLDAVRNLDPSAGPGSWPAEDERRQRLLVPLWGAKMERGNKTSTALFVQRRTADGKGRLFPRTLVQLLAGAVEHQGTIEGSPDRVLRAASILAGYNKASEKRVDDLRKEYGSLSPYLNALKRMTPTGTVPEITEHLKRAVARPKKGGGVAAGALHAGSGGWRKVIDRLLEIGVLREYKRARGDAGERKLEIALLYRPGLGIRAYGV